ncbi:hypothetical protein BB14905_04983 [Bacillus sp. B14905]|nr:hypothetical protein BB14905_04983 [Bacillus sp. B14905]
MRELAFVPRSREKDQDHWDIDRWENDGGSSIGGKGRHICLPKNS